MGFVSICGTSEFIFVRPRIEKNHQLTHLSSFEMVGVRGSKNITNADLWALSFSIMLETLSRDFSTGCPWEMLYVDDLMIIAMSLGGTAFEGMGWRRKACV